MLSSSSQAARSKSTFLAELMYAGDLLTCAYKPFLPAASYHRLLEISACVPSRGLPQWHQPQTMLAEAQAINQTLGRRHDLFHIVLD